MVTSVFCSDKMRTTNQNGKVRQPNALQSHVMARTGLSVAIGALAFGPSVVLAQAAADPGFFLIPWKIQPALTVMETYSNNINLSPAGAERSDFVTSISPSIIVQRRGPRLTLNLNYAPEVLLYANGTNGTDLRNTLSGNAKAELYEDHLFLDALAQVSQQNISPYSSLAADSVNGSSNRAETRVFSLGPSFRSRFGEQGSYNFGYRLQHTSANSNALASSTTKELYGAVNGGTNWTSIKWNLNYDRQDIGYNQFRDTSTQSTSATLSYLVNSRFSVFAVGGVDRNSYATLADEKSGGTFYSAGINWQPGPRTSLNAQHGHHYYGSSDSVQFTHRTRMTSWQLNYANDLTSSQQLLSAPANAATNASLSNFYANQFPDIQDRLNAIVNLLQQSQTLPNGDISQYNFLTNQYFLQKRLDASVAYIGQRDTVLLSYNLSNQKPLSDTEVPTVFTANQGFRQNGLSVNWSHNLGPRTSTNLRAERTTSSALAGGSGESHQRVLSAAIQRNLQRNLFASVTLRNTRQTSTDVTGNYKETAIVGSLRLQF